MEISPQDLCGTAHLDTVNVMLGAGRVCRKELFLQCLAVLIFKREYEAKEQTVGFLIFLFGDLAVKP